MRFNMALLRKYYTVSILILLLICSNAAVSFALTCGSNQSYTPSLYYPAQNQCYGGSWQWICFEDEYWCENYDEAWINLWVCPEACFYEVTGVTLTATPTKAQLTGNSATFTAQATSAGPNSYYYNFQTYKVFDPGADWISRQGYSSANSWNWLTPPVTDTSLQLDFYYVAVNAMTLSKYNAFGQFSYENESEEALLTYEIVMPQSPSVRPGYLLDFAVQNVPYSEQLYVVGDIGPFTWNITGGYLPSGLTLHENGEISGTTNQTGTYTFTAEATDSPNLYHSSKQFTLKVAPPFNVTSSLPSGTKDAPYNQTISVSGGLSPYKWISSGSLPPGLSLNENTGIISGTPTTTGSFSFDVEISHEENYVENGITYTPTISVLNHYTITINGPLSITTPVLPNANYGTTYPAFTLQAEGGETPYAWSIWNGDLAWQFKTLPPGLNINSSTGQISGVPTSSGSYDFKVEVTDNRYPSAGSIAFNVFNIVVFGPMSIYYPDSLLSGTVGSPYGQTLLASGGNGSYRWSFDSGNYPSNFTLNETTGLFSGTPTSPGHYDFTIRVRDTQGSPSSTTKRYIFDVYDPVSITTTSLPTSYFGQVYSQPLVASGGNQSYQWSYVSGSLPTGLSISSGGIVSGTPQGSPGRYTFTVQASDTQSPTPLTKTGIITIDVAYAPVSITTPTVSSATVGNAYSQTLAAIGGNLNYSWQIVSGSLPPHFTLSQGGIISGTLPTNETYAASYSFTAEVRDNQGTPATDSKPFTITVFSPLAIGTASLGNGISGTFYSQALAATGGNGSYIWTVVSGSLPAGLNLNPTPGLISGVVHDVGNFNFTIQLRDSQETSPVTASYAITIGNGTMARSTAFSNAVGYEASSAACFGSTADVMSGILIHDQDLFSTKGAAAFGTAMSLFYKSQPAYNGPLSSGWSHTYDIFLTENTDGSVVLQDGSGTKGLYTKSGSDYLSPPGDYSHLIKNGDGSYAITYRDGHSYQFNSSGRITSLVDRFANTITFGYSNGDLTAITDPTQRTTTIVYNQTTTPHRITAITDPNGATYDFTYQGTNCTNRLCRVTNPAATTGAERGYWEYQYNASGLLKSKRDPNNNITQYSYDPDQRMQSSIDPEGISTPAGHTRTLEYPTNSDNLRTTKLTEKDGGPWFYTYDVQAGLIKYKTDPNGKITNFYYYPNGSVKAKTEPKDGAVRLTTFFTYDNYGNVLTETEPADISPTDPDTVSNPATLGLKVARHYVYETTTANNIPYERLISISDERGATTLTTSFTYSTENGGEVVTATATPGNYVTTTKKYPNGTVREFIDANLKSTTFTYYPDSTENRSAGIVGLLWTVTDPAGITTTVTSYDKTGNPLVVTIKNTVGTVKLTSTQQHDALNRIKQLTKTPATVTLPTIITAYGYDLSGNLNSLIDAETRETKYEYNYNRQATKITDAKLNDTIFRYSGSGCGACGGGVDKLIGVYDAKVTKNSNLESQPHTGYQYDQLGRLDTETDPLGKKLHYTYYDNGQLKEKYDATAAIPGTLLVTHYYNHRGQLTDKIFTDGTAEHYTYTANGQLETAGNQHISYSYAYYTDGRLHTVTDTTNNRQISYDQYDNLGQRKQVTILKGVVADERVITYDYDAANRPWHITSTAGIFTYGYDNLGRRYTLSYPNSATTQWDYDDLNRLTAITHKINGGAAFAAFNYTEYDKVGNRKTVTGNKNETYGYDELYRLLYRQLSVTSTKPETFSFDAVGNRESGPKSSDIPYQHNAANQMIQGLRLGYGYDNAGNQTTKTVPNAPDKTWTRTWDYNNRVIKEEKIKGSTERRTVTYKYDPFGRRIEKKFEQLVDGITETETTTYVYDNEDIAVEHFTTSGGTEKTFFTHGPGIDEPLALERGSNYYYYHTDGIGSITHITNAGQGVEQSYEYEAYGLPTQSTDFRNSYQFVGKEYDWETGLIRMGVRGYDSMEGRFVSKDPSGFIDGVNLYSYVQNNPQNLIDPTGEYAEVIVSDSRMVSQGSQFGHVAININGIVYSRAHSRWDVKDASEYMNRQQSFRDSVGFELNTTPEEEQELYEFITTRISQNSAYDISSNSCSSNVSDALGHIGINVSGPWQFGGIAPVDILSNLPKTGRVIRRNWYGKHD